MVELFVLQQAEQEPVYGVSLFGGRIRKYYELTKEGRSCLAAVRQDLAGLVEEIIFAGKPSPAHR